MVTDEVFSWTQYVKGYGGKKIGIYTSEWRWDKQKSSIHEKINSDDNMLVPPQ